MIPRAYLSATVLLLAVTALPATAQDLDSLVNARLRTVASGAVVGVHHGEGDVTALSAWGRPAHGAADSLTAAAPFPFPALTGFLVATTVRALDARGVMDADQPVGRYLPGLPGTVAQVTVDQLLRHTAGLDDAPHPEAATLEEIVAGLPAEVAFTAPGAVYSRSRYSMPIVARALETATGLPLAQVIETALFEPLGMTGSTFEWADADALGLATGYGATLAAPGDPVAVDPPARVAGIPVLYTTVPDVMQLMAAWMGGGLAVGPDGLPGPPPRPELDAYLVDGLWHDRYQLLDEFSRSSQALGFAVTLRAYPETNTVVVAWVNFEGPGGGFAADPTEASLLAAEMAARVTERFLGPDVPVTVVEELPDTTAAVGGPELLPLWAWAGTYANGRALVELRTPTTEGLDAELVYFDGERELPLVRLADGSIVAVDPVGERIQVGFRALRDDAGRRYVFLGGRAYRLVEDEGG